jgi:hypothetical protein
MVTVKCITMFHDLVEDVMRNPGEEWSCDKERGDMLNARSLVNIIADDEVVQPEENKAVKPIYKKK